MAQNMPANASFLVALNRTSQFLPADAITVWASTYLTLCYAGGVENVLLATLIFRSSKLCTGCGLLIGHCLVAHAILSMLFHPMIAILAYAKHVVHWELPDVHCGYIMWFHMTCRYAADWIETYIAANRLIALSFPYKYRTFSKKKLENVIIGVFWVSSGVLACLGCFGIGVSYPRLPLGSCTVVQHNEFGLATFVIGYYAPLALAGAGYGMIYLRMLTNRRKNTVAVYINPKADKVKERKRLKKANMVFISFCWSVVSYLVMPLVMTISPRMLFEQPITAIWLGTLQILGYATNPIVFFVMSMEYRAELMRVVKRLTDGQVMIGNNNFTAEMAATRASVRLPSGSSAHNIWTAKDE